MISAPERHVSFVICSVTIDLQPKLILANESVLIDFACNDGERPSFGPDGMTIDADGFLYVAIWCGSKVLRIDPT